jgi:tetratricopeptide (TPR) repeat protein
MMKDSRSGGLNLLSSVRQWPKGLLVVIAWSTLVRLLHLVEFFENSPFAATLVSDAHIFDSWASRISGGDWAGGPQLFVLPPLYPYLLSLVYIVVGRTPATVVLLQSVLGVVASGLVWVLAHRRFGEIAGVTAGILFGAAGTVLFYESMLVGTSVAVFLTILVLVFLDRWRTDNAIRLLGCAGLCLGLLAILRPNFVVLIPVVLLLILWPYRKPRGREAIRVAGVFTTLAIAPLMILLIRNGVVAGEWTPLSAHGGINFYMGNHAGAPGWFSPPEGMAASITPHEPEGNLVGPRRIAETATGHRLSDREVSAFWFAKGLDFVVSEPAEAIRVTVRKIRLFFSAYELPLNYSFEYHRRYAAALNIPFGQLGLLYPLAIAGAFFAARRQKPIGDLLVLFSSYAASVIVFHVSTRYRMPTIPILAVFSGCAVQSLSDEIGARRWKPVAGLALAFGVMVALFAVERRTWDVARDQTMDPFNLGTSHLYAGRPDAAVPYLEEARQAGGRFPALFYNLGLSYAKDGKLSDALASYEEAISIDPGMAAAHTNLGNLLFQSGRYGEAEDAYRKALDADASSHNARAALGWVHFTYHRNDSARVEWATVLSQDPENASAVAGMKRLRAHP